VYDRLVDRLPPEDRAFLASELMLGPASGMLAERAPIVLAFGARIAEVLGSADPDIRDACARANFLVSLFDLISDGEAVQHVTLLLEDGRLDDVLSGPAGCAALRSSSLGLPVGPARVFGLLTADLFGDLHARRRGSGGRGRLGRTVQRAYRAQLRSRTAAGTADSLAVARGKSVLPFLIMGELVALDTPDDLRKAVFGGDVLEVMADRDVYPELLARVPGVVAVTQPGPRRLMVTTGDAATTTPQIMEALQAANMGVVGIEEHQPTFDEVFTGLVERRRQARGNGTEATAAEGDRSDG
jgi:hypothetical protein